MLESLFSKITGQNACYCIKKTPTQVLSCEICKMFNKFFSVNDYVQFLEIWFNFQIIIWIGVYIKVLEKCVHFHKIFLTGSNIIESSSKLFKQSPVKDLLYACSFLKKRLQLSCFPVILWNFLEHLLLLKLFFQSSLFSFWVVLARLTFTYSESTREALEQGVKNA